MMSHHNQQHISTIYDHSAYQPEHSPLIDTSPLNNFYMSDTQYPMLTAIPPPQPVMAYPTLNVSVGTQESCTRKHRNDSRSNGVEDISPDEETATKRFRKTDDNSSSLSTPTEKPQGEGLVAATEGESGVKVKKTKGRVKINMEYIPNKLRRYTTFSKRKSGIMKKAFELSTLTGTQVMLLVASETGHVYTFATPKLQPMITSERGKALIQTCLNSPDPMANPALSDPAQRMNMQGFEEMDLNYPVLSNADELKDIKLFSDSSMAFPTLSAAGISGLLPNSTSHHVIPSHIQMLNPAVQVNPPTSTMTYIHQHPEIHPPSSLNVPLSPAHSPRTSPAHLVGQNVNNLIVSQHKSASRTPSPHTPSPSQGMIASSPISEGYARIPLPSAQGFHPMMREAASPIISSSALLVQDRIYHNRNVTTTSQPRISPSSVPPQMHPSYQQDMRQQMNLASNQTISPYQTPTSSPLSQELLPQNI